MAIIGAARAGRKRHTANDRGRFIIESLLLRLLRLLNGLKLRLQGRLCLRLSLLLHLKLR
jgi:hypothetical protein